MPEPTMAALVFDAHGTQFDVHSVVEHCERRFPARGTELSRLWRTKELEYSSTTSRRETPRGVSRGICQPRTDLKFAGDVTGSAVGSLREPCSLVEGSKFNPFSGRKQLHL